MPGSANGGIAAIERGEQCWKMARSSFDRQGLRRRESAFEEQGREVESVLYLKSSLGRVYAGRVTAVARGVRGAHDPPRSRARRWGPLGRPSSRGGAAGDAPV